jgi:fatty-acyl-CoA synthase
MDLSITRTPSAYSSPLLINSILEAGVGSAPDQEIVYAGKLRMTYRDLGERVRRLASMH